MAPFNRGCKILVKNNDDGCPNMRRLHLNMIGWMDIKQRASVMEIEVDLTPLHILNDRPFTNSIGQLWHMDMGIK